MQLMRQAGLLILTLLFAPAVASAQCDDKLGSGEFETLLGTSGTPAEIVWPEGVFPLGYPMDVTIKEAPPAEEAWRYRGYVRLQGNGGDPIPLKVGSVSIDRQTGETTVRLHVAFDGEREPYLISGASFVVTACSDGEGDEATLESFASIERSVSTWRLGALVAAAVATVAIVIILLAARRLGARRDEGRAISGKEERWGVRGLFVDFRNRVSLSQFQVFLFSAAVLIAVAYVFGRTMELSDLSEDVLLLLGISAAGGIAGKLGDVSKNRLSWENWAWLNFELNAFPKGEGAARPHWFQLVSTQGAFDIYRFQALIFSLFVAPAFVVMSLYSLGEANIPVGILSVLGLSQVTYVAGKIAIQPTMQDFNESVTKMRERIDNGETVTEREALSFVREFESAIETKWNPDRPFHGTA